MKRNYVGAMATLEQPMNATNFNVTAAASDGKILVMMTELRL